MNDILTVEEAAVYLRVGRARLYAAIKKNTVPGVIRIGRVIRLRKQALETWGSQQKLDI